MLERQTKVVAGRTWIDTATSSVVEASAVTDERYSMAQVFNEISCEHFMHPPARYRRDKRADKTERMDAARVGLGVL